jgi:hypothetical protein
MKEQNERHILEAVRAAVIKAVPEIVVNEHAQLIKFDHSVEYFKQTRPIRLADERWPRLSEGHRRRGAAHAQHGRERL